MPRGAAPCCAVLCLQAVKVDRTTNPRWCAPEVLHSKQLTRAADVYSYAIIMWELLTWLRPFEDIHSVSVGPAGEGWRRGGVDAWHGARGGWGNGGGCRGASAGEGPAAVAGVRPSGTQGGRFRVGFCRSSVLLHSLSNAAHLRPHLPCTYPP